MSAGRLISYAQAINEGLSTALETDPSVLCFGLGIDDPKGIFGTTMGLKEQFGSKRVFDTPVSENGMTGIGIGAALHGMRPVMTHQRLDFFLLAMDQLVNNAAKWHYMYGSQQSVPITVRLILGQGWGQGPTHSQNLQSWFAHIPGLKVVSPATAQDAKGLLLSSIFDPNPVVFLEHRWCHNVTGDVPAGDVRVPLGKANLMSEGDRATVVAMSHLSLEAKIACDFLRSDLGVAVDLIDLRTIAPLDFETISTSIRKTGHLLALDASHATCSVAADIVAKVATELWGNLKEAPRLLALPDVPSPTSFALTRGYYVTPQKIAETVLDLVGRGEDKPKAERLRKAAAHDVPGEWFKGPF